jgi:hypothetical protein
MTPAEKIRAANSRLGQVAAGCRDRETKTLLAELSKAIGAALAEAEFPPENLAKTPKTFRYGGVL